MTTAIETRVREEFARRFGGAPALIARAPGRVNLIGDHTDYNDGFVLPVAIDRAVWIALRPRDDHDVVVHSLDFHETAQLRNIDALRRDGSATADATADATVDASSGWIEYVRGVAWALDEAQYRLCGWDGVMAGDVPLGAGLSSSAALELAVARAFAGASEIAWEPVTMARLAQRAENQWVGVNCGIMDQLISAAGVAGHAVCIDCRSLDMRKVPLPVDAAVVVLDTATRRGLVDSLYNERREQCEAAARWFGVPALRDVDLATFEARADGLDVVTRRRARHVITENARTVAAADALAAGDVACVGMLMNESHASLRDDFDVSRAELDAMVRIAQRHDACHGARMTGAGFGGCAVALTRGGDAAIAFAADVAKQYAEAVGLTPAVYVCAAADGASVGAA